MKFLKVSVRLSLICFALCIDALAQPGETCVLDYNPFEIKELGYVYANLGFRAGYSSEVFEQRINSQHIFIGKVVSQESKKLFKVEGFREDIFTSVKINVTDEIAGKLNKMTIDLTIKTNCWQTRGQLENGSDYVFFAGVINTKSFKGLVSSKWSAPLDGIPKNEIDEITKKILDYRNGAKQPLVVGYLIKHKSNPYWDYVNHSFNSGFTWRLPKFKNDWRIKKWEYDPEYADPLKGVKVIVKNLEGLEIATTRTDSGGRFEFADLQKGNYVIYPDVPKSYLIVGKCYLNDEKKGGVGFYVPENKRVCDRTIRLDVAPVGKFEAEIGLEQGSWQDSTVPDVYLVGANSKTGEIYQDYLVKIPVGANFDKKLSLTVDKVMAGEYILRIGTSLGSDIYYPGVRDIKKAQIIKIDEGKTTNANFSISSLKNNNVIK